MNTTNFNTLYSQLKTGVETVAKNSLHDYEQQAKQDGETALTTMKTNLQHWTAEVENGSMTGSDLSFLLQGDESLSEMVALKEAGLSEVRIDQFRNGLINMVVSTLTGFIKV
ncbi:MAG: hypothetical protein INR73_15465 [Williamsia sp.]|nr:hypothetical protein [Williamsia sp.]